MRLLSLALLVGVICLPLLGCGSGSPEVVGSSDIQDYINNNPEAMARQAAGNAADR